MQPAKQRWMMPPRVANALAVFGILYTVVVLILMREMVLTLTFLTVCLFMLPSVMFLLGYGLVYERIAGHRPKFILHDRDTGYHLNKPIVYRCLEAVVSVILTVGLLNFLTSYSDGRIVQLPSLAFSIVFFLGSAAYFAIRLNYRLQPARDERAANEQKIAAGEARKAYEATIQPVTPPDLAPLLTLATQGLINQKSVIIGMSTDRASLPIYYRDDERFRHTYIIGSTGSGKTTFLCTQIAQDIHYGNGVIVLGAEKDLFERLLTFISQERADDLIYFDPTDTKPPIIGFNPFAVDGEDLNQKAGETMTILKRAMGSDLGVTMEPIIDYAVSALVQHPHATFADLIRLIDPSDKTFRTTIKNDPNLDEDTRTFWQRYDQTTYYRKSYDAVRNRFTPFSRQPISTVLATPSLSFKTELNKDRYIIFLDLSQLRDTALVTMGQLLLASIQQSLLTRDALSEKQRIPYHLYIDEFQTYATDSEKSLIDIFNGARKYKLAVTIAHQTTAGIPDKLFSSIVGNASTNIVLNLKAADAPFFAKQLRIKKPGRDVFDPEALQDLRQGEGYVQTPTHQLGVKIAIPIQPLVPLPMLQDNLKTRSKENFGTEPPTEPILSDQSDQPDPPKPPVPQKKKSFGITFE